MRSMGLVCGVLWQGVKNNSTLAAGQERLPFAAVVEGRVVANHVNDPVTPQATSWVVQVRNKQVGVVSAAWC
jgi:hypothetical protein